MALTSPDNIWTQDSADGYDLVIDAAATAASVQAALTARANSYTGTTAQRTAFTATAPEGTLWSDTNGDKSLWIKQGASWVAVWGKGQGLGSPAGTITQYAGATAPSSWLLCQGQAISRATYANLFAVTGTAYGAGDGSTTFNVPNLSGRVPVGLQTSDTDFNTLGKTGGEKTHTLTLSQIPAHQHSLDQDGGNVGFAEGSTNLRYSVGYTNTRASASIATGDAGGGNAHNNLQPYLVLNYIIKT